MPFAIGRGSLYIFSLLFWSRIITNVEGASQKPNIIFILSDDMGWNDVSYNGMNEIKTPNIDTLAADGVILNQYYAEPICSPSRSALMTSLYPIRTGFQHLPLLDGMPYGLAPNHTILPQRLRELGYTTKGVGKWHIGYHKKEYTPTHRGFDSFYGYWGGVVDYYQYVAPSKVTPQTSINRPAVATNSTRMFTGYQLYDDMKPVEGVAGQHLTKVLTKRAVEIIRSHDQEKPLFLYFSPISVHAPPATMPLRSPKKYDTKFSYISNILRRNFAGDLTILDEAVGDVMEELERANMLKNTIVIFSSDNGGGNTIFPNGGSNYPLRGTKISCFEGGVRVPGLVWSPLLNKRNTVSNEMIHITDWFPTFYHIAGGDVKDLGEIDGMDQSKTIFQGQPTNRTEFLVNINPIFKTSGLRSGRYKLIYGRNKVIETENWYPPTGRVAQDPNVSYKNKVEGVLKRFHRKPHMTFKVNLKHVDCGGRRPVYNATDCIVTPCLYDLENDPCEYYDVSKDHPEETQELFKKLQDFVKVMVPPFPQIIDYNSNPMKHCGLWTPWLDPEYQNMTCSAVRS